MPGRLRVPSPHHYYRDSKRVLDNGYWPDTLKEAHEIIFALRERLAAFNVVHLPPKGCGLTRSQYLVYNFIKTKGEAPKDQVYALLYGGRIDGGPQVKILDAFMCKIRKKLPPNECIETVWGSGYRWVEVEAA